MSVLKFRHKDTCEEIMVDNSLPPRYRRLSMGFLNKLRLSGRSFLKHITLTQSQESYHPRIVNNFFSAMRRRYNFDYVWTVELQERGVIHWHCIVAFYDLDRFGAEDIKKMQSYWKYGYIAVTPVRRPSLGYIMKYITKSFDALVLNVRRIGSSLIPAYYRQSWKNLVNAIQYFVSAGMGLDGLSDFWWYNGSAFLYADCKNKHGRHYIYKRIKKWDFISEYQGVPF